jgi:hypothetical protein
MRNLFIIMASLLSCPLYGQQLNGVVMDKQTRQLLSNAMITSSNAIAFSDIQGRFTINAKSLDDTISISKSGYKTCQITARAAQTAIVIELIKQVIELDEVKVFAKREE